MSGNVRVLKLSGWATQCLEAGLLKSNVFRGLPGKRNESSRDLAWGRQEGFNQITGVWFPQGSDLVPTSLLKLLRKPCWPIVIPALRQISFTSSKGHLKPWGIPRIWILLMLKRGFKGHSQIKLTEPDKHASATGQSWLESSAKHESANWKWVICSLGSHRVSRNASFYQFINMAWIPENSGFCDWQSISPTNTSEMYIHSRSVKKQTMPYLFIFLRCIFSQFIIILKMVFLSRPEVSFGKALPVLFVVSPAFSTVPGTHQVHSDT